MDGRCLLKLSKVLLRKNCGFGSTFLPRRWGMKNNCYLLCDRFWRKAGWFSGESFRRRSSNPFGSLTKKLTNFSLTDNMAGRFEELKFIWYGIFVNCDWFDTRWQQHSTHLHTNNTMKTEFTERNIHNIKVNVKWSRYMPGVARRVCRCVAVLFNDRGTRMGWVVSSTHRPNFTSGKDHVSVLQEDGWAPGPVWTGGKSRPYRD